MILAAGLIYFIGADTTGHLLLTVIALGIIILIFGVASIINLIKGITLYIDYKETMIAKRLVLGLVLIGIVIAIPTSKVISNRMHRENIKKHNRAIQEIGQIKWSLELFWDKHRAYPMESQGLDVLRNYDTKNISFVDPWGRPYGYRLEEAHDINRNHVPYVWSSGVDGLSGTDDDIDDKSRYRVPPYYHYPAA